MRFYLAIPLVLLSVLSLGCGTVSVTGIQNSIDCTSVAIQSFATDIVPVFSSRTCTDAGCHIGSLPAGDLDLDVAGSDAGTIYTNLTTSGALDTGADPSAPLDSILVGKPTIGLLEHEGGDIFLDLSDVDLAKVYCWIEQGAANN